MGLRQDKGGWLFRQSPALQEQTGGGVQAAGKESSGQKAPAGGKLCEQVPGLWSDFVDTFVDFAVGGYVLGPTRPSEDLPGRPGVTVLPSAERIVAVGDIHGDVAKVQKALQIAGLVDDKDRWIGKSTVLVQVGDQLDRGGDELAVLYLLEKLRREAPRYGGQVYVLQGNHETGNIDGWFRYATPAGLRDFDRWATWVRIGNSIKQNCQGLPVLPDPLAGVPPHIPSREKARYAALRPGGPISTRLMASHPAVLVVGSSVFVHGGLLPEHVEYGLEKINQETRDWVLGDQGSGTGLWGKAPPKSPQFFRGADALVWTRKYSERRESECDCELLTKTLAKMPGVQRMVVGHTIQQPTGINTACRGQVVRTDVGMSKGCYDAAPEVLEIVGDYKLRVLSHRGPPRVLDSGPEPQRVGLAEILSAAARVG